MLNTKVKFILFVSVALALSGCSLQIPASQDPTLDLSGKGLTKIPASVFEMSDLRNLNISNNELTGALPSELGNLKQLTVLNASHNKFTGIPAEIGRLLNLTEVDFSYNSITGLPLELGNLKNLQTLNLAGNPYSASDLEKIEKMLPKSTIIIK